MRPVLVLLMFHLSVAAVGIPPVHDDPCFPYTYLDEDGRLCYAPYTNRGDRVPDFSFCGYSGGGVRLPDVPVWMALEPDPTSSDDRARIQAAIEGLSEFPLDEQGFRGALLLKRGEYRLDAAPDPTDEPCHSLVIRASGVVLRGEGRGPDGTVLKAIAQVPGRLIVAATGPDGRQDDRPREWRIVDDYLPVNFSSFHVDRADGLSLGDGVLICRHTNMEWVKAIRADEIVRGASEEQVAREPNALDSLGRRKYFKDAQGWWMQRMPWMPGPRESFMRTVRAVDGNRVTIDIPVPQEFSQEYGGGTVRRAGAFGQENIGFERFRIVADWRKDEKGFDTREHFDNGIWLEGVRNAWVRDVSSFNLYGSSVRVGQGCCFVTVQDCRHDGQPSDVMASDIRGYYGGGAFVCDGQMTLFQRCFAENVRHYGYVVGARVGGPNVFLDCNGRLSSGCAETHHRWSPGVLWDCMGHVWPTNVGIFDRRGAGSGHGWTTNNSLLWNCVGEMIIAESPPIGHNFCVGCIGVGSPDGKPQVEPGRSKQVESYFCEGNFVAPRSLYLAQLQQRLGPTAVSNIAAPWQIIGRTVSVMVHYVPETRSVFMSCPQLGAEIRYTSDGAEPTREAGLYDGSFVMETAVIKVRAFKPGLSPSPVRVLQVNADGTWHIFDSCE